MERFVTFSKLTEKGQALPPAEAAAVLAKVLEIVQAYGGKMEQILATTGRYDFVSVVDYPDAESGFKAHTKITQLGLFTLESATAFPIETFISAVLEEKVAVAV